MGFGRVKGMECVCLPMVGYTFSGSHLEGSLMNLFLDGPITDVTSNDVTCNGGKNLHFPASSLSINGR